MGYKNETWNWFGRQTLYWLTQQSFRQIRVSQQTLNAQLLSEQSTSMHQRQKLDQVMSHQEAQQKVLQQAVGDTRTGFQLIDRVVTNREERLSPQGQINIPASARGRVDFPLYNMAKVVVSEKRLLVDYPKQRLYRIPRSNLILVSLAWARDKTCLPHRR